MARSLAALACLLPVSVAAQPAPGMVEGQLLQRQQYQDELLLRQRQFQELIDPALTPGERLGLERRHFDQSQRQRQLYDSQLRRHQALEAELPRLPPIRQQELGTYELWRFEMERASESQALEFDP